MPTKPRVAKPAPKPVAKTAPAKKLSAFQQALAVVLVHEGGKVDHPKDPGGRTNRGITQRVYNAWRGKSNLPVKDVFGISTAEVEAIYKFQYWDAIKGDLLPVGVSYPVFDAAVHSGPKQGIKWLQRALQPLYTGAIDGVIGSLTLDAVEATNDNDLLIARMEARRLVFLQSLKTWPTFGKGWSRRVADVLARGQAWASGSIGPKVVFIEDANEKAPITDAKQAPSKGLADATAGGGLGGAGIGGALQTAQESLTPLSMAGDWIGTMVAILIIGGLVIAIGGFAFRFYAAKKKSALEDALDVEPVTK